MTLWEFEAGLGALLFLLLAPLAAIPILNRAYARNGRVRPLPFVLALAVVAYACGLVAYTLLPLPDAATLTCPDEGLASQWQLRPFGTIGVIGDEVAASGLLGALTGTVFLQVAFNVLLFVPLGALLAYAGRARLGTTALVGLGLSLAIEATQGTGLWWLYPCPYRFADVDDLILNTSGAVVGWLLGARMTRVAPLDATTRVEDLGPPSLGRRATSVFVDVTLVAVLGVALQIAVLGPLVAGAGVEPSEPALRTLAHAVNTLAATVLLLGVPLVTRARATPGQRVVRLAVAPATGTDAVSARAIVVRFSVRWLPWLIASAAVATSGAAATFLLVAALGADAVTALARADRRSLSSLVSGTRAVTADWAHAQRADAAPAPPR